mgnify:CR=1 FL=1
MAAMALVMGKYNTKKLDGKVLNSTIISFYEHLKDQKMLIDSDPDNVDKGEIENMANIFLEF